MLEVRTIGSDAAPASLKRFIYSNHLQSATLELDESGNIISYEEYHPYGTTAYQAMNSDIGAVAKRYRFTGKERDEESGLSYHGARYYIPWLCRWAAVDPLESKYAGLSPYNYCENNPIIKLDKSGMGPDIWNTGNNGNSTPQRPKTDTIEINTNGISQAITPNQITDKQEIQLPNIRTIFISSLSGKYLGEPRGFVEPDRNLITDPFSGLSVRAIDESNYNDLVRANAINNAIPIYPGSSENISFAASSAIVHTDNEKIINDFNEISKPKSIEGKGEIERNLSIVFDRSKNLITSYIEDDSKNTASESFFNLNQDAANRESSNYFVSRSSSNNHIVMATAHTHPYISPPSRRGIDNSTSMGASYDVNDIGGSEKDETSAYARKAISFIIEVFDKKNFISSIDENKHHNNHFTTLQAISNSQINLAITTFLNYIQWHR